MDSKELLELIKSRRSVRQYEGREVPPELLEQILEAGRWAPSGLNNQPWRFVTVWDKALKAEVASHTRYGKVIENAGVIIAVFIHKPSMYHLVKDSQAMGACLENMLLMAHGLGLGAVWLGEILKNAEPVREALGVSGDHELHAVVALGWPAGKTAPGSRKALDELKPESKIS